MIAVEEARDLVRRALRDFGTEEVALYESIGRVLRESWYCDRDLPPYDRVTMDGIAVAYDDVDLSSPIMIEGMAKAGDPQHVIGDPAKCLEVMTGAVLPQGLDTVIRYEDVHIDAGRARISAEVTKDQNVHFKGLDRKKGDLLVTSGVKISSAEVGIGASIGQTKTMVARLPKVVIVSTGDELVEIDEQPAAHQIRRGNVYRIQSSLMDKGIIADTDHIADDLEATQRRIAEHLQTYDVIILSGGVSKGKLDYVPEALRSCGVKQIFHKIRQRPGKPMWFGEVEGGPVVFGLPGNPVSSFMCFQVYFLYWLELCLGYTSKPMMVSLARAVTFKPDLTYFLEVSLSSDEDGILLAHPQRGNGSGDFANLTRADGFVELARGRDLYEKGEVYPFVSYR